MSNRLTIEQTQVVEHPPGYHARVLAVAGSGKSTTMAYRIRHLVRNLGYRPGSVLVLMFNALARKQFGEHLDKTGLPEELQPAVHTFHSFSFQVIGEGIKRSLLAPNTQFWLGDKAELVWLTVNRAIRELEKSKRIPPEAVDPEEALHAIGLWKGSLIPPARAGSFASTYLPQVYDQFEQMRQAQSAVTYDDFIPLAIELLESDPLLHLKYTRDLQQLIIDEYQDINLGQQRLIELLAGEQADVMVVGDDDQTIYEWRGARPNYIIADFNKVFTSKPVLDYRLSRSFRFGPLIAQCAANVIACNSNRVDKPLIAFQSGKEGFIHLLNGGYSSIKELTGEVQTLLNVDRIPPKEIAVLARMYAQLDNLEAEFLAQTIPYQVDGQEPFFRRKEINTLLDYIRLAAELNRQVTSENSRWLLSVANKPSRMLSRAVLERLLAAMRGRSLTIRQGLENAAYGYIYGLDGWQSRKLLELFNFLVDLADKIHHADAGQVLAWIVSSLDFLAYYQDYYGKGENSDEKAHAITNFIRYVSFLHTTPLGLLDQLAKLDTTQGRPPEELVHFTTIFRTKGLEFDYVILPQCDENLLPYLKGESLQVYDTRGLVKESLLSNALEAERRLFYVALTRARKGVLIGSSAVPSRFLSEIQLDPTERVMNALQQLAAGHNNARQDLTRMVRGNDHSPVLLNNLLQGYLPDLHEPELLAELGELPVKKGGITQKHRS